MVAIMMLAAVLGQAAKAPQAAPAEDEGLADWGVQPFSDQGSHVVLVRGQGQTPHAFDPAGAAAASYDRLAAANSASQGFTQWTLRSAFAFGALAAQPHPAKDLVDWRLELRVEGEEGPRFEGLPSVLRSFPRWLQESVEKEGLSAESTLLWPATDVLVGACNVANRSGKPLRMRAVLVLKRSLPGLDATATFDEVRQQLSLELNRGKSAGRALVEHVAVHLGGGRLRLDALDKQGLQAVPSRAPLALKDGFELRLALEQPLLLPSGGGARLPYLLAAALKADEARKLAAAEWARSGLPKGLAYQAAKLRWAKTRSALPKPADPPLEPLVRRAALALLAGEYAKRGQLDEPMFSAAKGSRDCFGAVELPLACLGWAELDFGRAEQALLQWTSFSALAPAPIPPHSGEELLPWEATGLPLHGLAAFELYHRDPEPARASAFLRSFAGRLRNEAAYWPGARDGDGNGLYAFARDEEKPAYLSSPPSAQEPPSPPHSGEGRGASVPQGGGERSEGVKLQTWSYALSSLVAWQLQAASALASQASQADEADKLMALSLKTRAALRQASAQPEAQAQGLDQLWPLHLGLEDDPARAKALLEALLLPLLSQDPPLQEQGALHPWRAYLWVRLLAQYGYRDQARAAAKALAGFLAKTPVLWSAYAAQPQGAPGDLATASAALGLALERYEQEAFLLPWTRNLEGRILQVRSLDGRIYMKRLRLPAAKAPYAKLRLASPKGGAILDEKAWIFDCDEPAVLSLVSETPLQVAELGKNKKILFKETTRADMIVKKGVKYEVLLKER